MRKQERFGNLAAVLGAAFEGTPRTLKALSTPFFNIQNHCNGASPAPVLAALAHMALLSHRPFGHIRSSQASAINLVIMVFHAAPSQRGRNWGIDLGL